MATRNKHDQVKKSANSAAKTYCTRVVGVHYAPRNKVVETEHFRTTQVRVLQLQLGWRIAITMSAPLRRAKLLDAVFASGMLLVFTAVPLAVRFSDARTPFPSTVLNSVYIACVVASWPFFIVGASVLTFFWSRGRTTDRHELSDVSATALSVILSACVCIVLACALLLVGVLVALVERALQRVSWVLAVDVTAVALVCGIVGLLFALVGEVFRAGRLAKRGGGVQGARKEATIGKLVSASLSDERSSVASVARGGLANGQRASFITFKEDVILNDGDDIVTDSVIADSDAIQL